MTADVEDWRRSAGTGRYAHSERERRFLVGSVPTAVIRSSREIEDRYITGTDLRLRRVSVGDDCVWKLTQKVRSVVEDPAEVAITSIYLRQEEYELLRALPASLLSKTRGIVLADGARIAVDAFHGSLDGLMLAEVEVAELSDQLALPAWIGAEVTHDDRYAGGTLAGLGADEASALVTGTLRQRPNPSATDSTKQ